MKRIVVLGSTGSIGTQTLDVIRRCPENFTVAALAVRASVDKLEKQVEEFHPEAAVVYDEIRRHAVTETIPVSVSGHCGKSI